MAKKVVLTYQQAIERFVPKEYQAAMLRNCDRLQEECIYDKPVRILNNAFQWRNSPEGYNFWNDVAIKLSKIKEKR